MDIRENERHKSVISVSHDIQCVDYGLLGFDDVWFEDISVSENPLLSSKGLPPKRSYLFTKLRVTS